MKIQRNTGPNKNKKKRKGKERRKKHADVEEYLSWNWGKHQTVTMMVIGGNETCHIQYVRRGEKLRCCPPIRPCCPKEKQKGKGKTPNSPLLV